MLSMLERDAQYSNVGGLFSREKVFRIGEIVSHQKAIAATSDLLIEVGLSVVSGQSSQTRISLLIEQDHR